MIAHDLGESIGCQYINNTLSGLFCLINVYDEMPEMKQVELAYLDTLRDYMLSLPIVEKLRQSSNMTKVFLDYGINICINPYWGKSKNLEFDDYYNLANKMVYLISVHPEIGCLCQDNLRRAFEQAAVFTIQGKKSKSQRKMNVDYVYWQKNCLT